MNTHTNHGAEITIEDSDPADIDILSLLDAPWTVTDDDGSVDIYSSKGEFICSVHGDTLGVQLDRASLIAKSPETLKQCRHLESKIKELLLPMRPISECDMSPLFKK